MFVGELAAVSALLAASLQLKSFSLTQTNTKVFQMDPLCPVYAKLVRGSGGLKFSWFCMLSCKQVHDYTPTK